MGNTELGRGDVVMVRDRYDPYWQSIGRLIKVDEYGRYIVQHTPYCSKSWNYAEPFDVNHYFDDRFTDKEDKWQKQR